MNAITDYVEMWRILQFYHRAENAADREVRLKGYMRLKVRSLEPPRARRHLMRFMERESARSPGGPS